MPNGGRERRCQTAGESGLVVSRSLAVPLLTPLGIFVVRHFRSLARPPFGTSAVCARSFVACAVRRSAFAHRCSIDDGVARAQRPGRPGSPPRLASRTYSSYFRASAQPSTAASPTMSHSRFRAACAAALTLFVLVG